MLSPNHHVSKPNESANTVTHHGESNRREPNRGVLRRYLLVLSMLAPLLLSSCGLFSSDGDGKPTPTSIAPPPEVDIAYGPVPGCPGPGSDDPCGGSQTLDIYRADGVDPKDSKSTDPRPVALWIHGGGFIAGDKQGSLSRYYQPLLDDGWDIVAINYRLSKNGQNVFPTALGDVKRAVRWVKANAAAQGWDAKAVAAIGHSAGGNLSEMLAVTGNDQALEPGDLPPELQAVDSTVIAAIGVSAVSDMRTFMATGYFTQAAHDYIGCAKGCDSLLDQSSVQTHVDGDSAPLFALHGVDDPWAQPSQGELVKDAYGKTGISDRFKLQIVSDGPKEFRSHDLDIERWIGDIQDFLDDHLPPSA